MHTVFDLKNAHKIIYMVNNFITPHPTSLKILSNCDLLLTFVLQNFQVDMIIHADPSKANRGTVR